MRKVVGRSLALALALLMVFACATAFAQPAPLLKMPETCTLIIRALVTDDAAVKTPIRFTYTVNGGKAVDVVLAATKTAQDSSSYVMVMPKGAKVVVTQDAADAARFDTTVNGVQGDSTELTIVVGNNVAEFVNAPNPEPEELAPTGDL